ncbi:magnesium transporter CorA family protein [Phenylobacterium sp.]|jgi:magnesium transporter|uniref:magnesium transporter CorA family protein n=1 Tax=Phenylobacterium sp. TaxID=1871053 RepID=UPI002F3E20BB
MLKILRRGADHPETVTLRAGWTPPADTLWLDLIAPGREEELAVEAALSVELPTREEMAAIEPSSRLFQAAGATFMTATLLSRRDDDSRVPTPVTFVLAKGVLVTIRYDAIKAFDLFADRAKALGVATGSSCLFGLLDAVMERLADLLERADTEVQRVSAAIFGKPKAGQFEVLLTELARAQSLTSLTRASLVGLARLFAFAALAREIADDHDCLAHLHALQHDGQSLTEHADAQSGQVSFLLDAALGLINIEQNGIIKFFSVAAVILMPPTLVASVYGMNFHHMPELELAYGYPMALGLMLISAVLPVIWFKRRGWF